VVCGGRAGLGRGRYFFKLYITKFSDKGIARQKTEELRYVGKKSTGDYGRPGCSYSPTRCSVVHPRTLYGGGDDGGAGDASIPPFLARNFTASVMVMAAATPAPAWDHLLHGALRVAEPAHRRNHCCSSPEISFIDGRAACKEDHQITFLFIWKIARGESSTFKSPRHTDGRPDKHCRHVRSPRTARRCARISGVRTRGPRGGLSPRRARNRGPAAGRIRRSGSRRPTRSDKSTLSSTRRFRARATSPIT